MDCAVCCNDMQNGERPAKMQKTGLNSANSSDICCTPCGHVFHKKCLLDWFQSEKDKSGVTGDAKKGTCPTCRSDVHVSALYPIYFPMNSSSRSSSSSTSQKAFPNPPVFSFSNSNQNTSGNKSDLELRLQLLKKDLENMTEKMANEKERADINQAIINSLTNDSTEDNKDESWQQAPSTGFVFISNNSRSSPTENDRKDSESQSNDDDQQERGQSLTSTTGFFNFFSFDRSTANDDDTSNNDSDDEENDDKDDDDDMDIFSF